MSRDPEAERYELQAQRERDEALGQALFEHRRPNAPKAWEELSEADRTEWILIAVDQERAKAGHGYTDDQRVADQRGRTLRGDLPVDTDMQAQAVGRLAGVLQRVWLSGKPFEPGGGINWTRFAEALITDEGVR